MIRLSDLQLEVMQVLWDRGEASIADVHAVLEARHGLAYTTVSTLLKRLEDKRAVKRRREGRVLVYAPRVDQAAVRGRMVGNLVDRLFEGDPAALVSHLLGDEKVTDDDIDRIRALLHKHGDDND
ncbi:MAG: BlaI/MecI/CopY family transcriptional regulator [Xanthomonadales bacterium]|nr:BlaI/MecI/CopY family transcriptional regulator [Xanthomonadales bacterium]